MISATPGQEPEIELALIWRLRACSPNCVHVVFSWKSA
jgi:hypothetical protein